MTMNYSSPSRKKKNAQPPANPRLLLTHGEKGGVGKTTVARLIAEFLLSRDTSFQAFDAEGPTGQLLRFHPDHTVSVEMDKAISLAPILDFLMDGGANRLALVDLGARSGEDLKNWLYKAGALEEAEAGQLDITIIYVLGGAIDSVGHLKDCFAALGSTITYVVVKNFGVAAQFGIYENSTIRKELRAAGAIEIALPALEGVVYQSVDKTSLPFSAFCNSEAGFTERRYCRTWLRECFGALEGASEALV